MRKKTFTTPERIVLMPVELLGALKGALLILPVFFFIDFFWKSGRFWADAAKQGLHSILGILAAVLAGAVVTPLLLPWLPGRAFSLKGLIPGLSAAVVFLVLDPADWNARAGFSSNLGWLLLLPAISTYLAMNFTGSSTYTSLSGVRKEMRRAVPFQIGAGLLGLGFWLASHMGR